MNFNPLNWLSKRVITMKIHGTLSSKDAARVGVILAVATGLALLVLASCVGVALVLWAWG